ncbi:hypothetical protein ES708_04793 [subsurface metagenome]
MALQGQRRSGDQSGVGTALSPTADIGGACLIFWQEDGSLFLPTTNPCSREFESNLMIDAEQKRSIPQFRLVQEFSVYGTLNNCESFLVS